MSFTGPQIRQQVIDLIRLYFTTHHFTEVDVPSLLPTLPLEPNLYALPVSWDQYPHYFITSPESSLKKLISTGIGNCFSLAHVARNNETIGPAHNLEFMMLEWYEIGKTVTNIATSTEKLINTIYQGILKYQNKRPTNLLTCQNHTIDLTPPWHRFTLSHLFQKYANIKLSDNLDFTDIKKTAAAKGYNTDGVTTWEPLYTQIFINEIEPNLPTDKPVFISDYPTQLSPLCKPCPDQLGFSQRFEFYIGGMEIGNAYTELTNSKTLQKNFARERRFRLQHQLPTPPIDQNFIKSTNSLPECAGIGLGVDRLAMLFTDTTNIADVLYFPTARLI